MSLFDIFKKSKKDKEPAPQLPQYLYDDSEIEELDSFIADMFGDYKNVFHEIASPDVHLDVCIVDPTDEEPYYKLVTMGAGALFEKLDQKGIRYRVLDLERESGG